MSLFNYIKPKCFSTQVNVLSTVLSTVHSIQKKELLLISSMRFALSSYKVIFTVCLAFSISVAEFKYWKNPWWSGRLPYSSTRLDGSFMRKTTLAGSEKASAWATVRWQSHKLSYFLINESNQEEQTLTVHEYYSTANSYILQLFFQKIHLHC